MSEGFTIINNDILNDANLEPMEKLTLIHLLQFYNKEKGYAFPSMKTLTELLKYSHDRYTKKILDSLIEKGYVTRETIKQKNRYFISIGTVQNVPNVQNVPKVQNVPNNTVQNVPNSKVQNVPTTNTNTNTITKTNIYSEIDIAEIRKLYPGDKNRKDALAKLPKLLNEYGKEQLIRCIERYKNHVLEKRKTFNQQYKNEKTFWNGGYMDYLDSEYGIKEKPPIQNSSENKKYTTEGLPPDVAEFLSGRC